MMSSHKNVVQLHIITLIYKILISLIIQGFISATRDMTSKCDIYNYIYNYKTSHKCHLQLVVTTWLCNSKDRIINNISYSNGLSVTTIAIAV